MTRSLLQHGCLFSLLVLICFVGESFGDDFPEIVNNESDVNAEPMPAKQAAETMKLPDGFEAKVFACEPDVQNPIAMAWDERGRMWVAENYTYSDRSQHFDLSMRDRVIILHDTDGDGKSDERKVFTDKVQMLTSVELGRGGVWLMCPPQLLFIPDENQDDIPDGPPQVILDGFTVAKANYHNFANGLRWGPDGWLYGRCGHSCPGKIGLPGTAENDRVPIDGGIWRYHPERKTVEVLTHGTVNPWGHDWDKNGELFFINTVIGHLWHCIPGAHFTESFGESPNPLVFERLDMIADHYHYDRSGSWTASRNGAANDLGGGHAHIGMMIYQNDVWPARYRDKLFTMNMHGLRANVETVRRHGSGYLASHEPDFLIAKDPFFRAIEISVGPDGQVYVIDWSDTGECHDHTGVHRTSGRVYKIEYRDAAPSKVPFTKPRCMAAEGPLPGIWRDYQSGSLTEEQMLALTSHENEHVRAWAIRLLMDHWPIDTFHGPQPSATYPKSTDTIETLTRVAREDTSGLVHLVVASCLQRLPVDQRAGVAIELVRHSRYADDRDLPSMVWFGLMPLVDEDLESLVEVAKACQIPSTLKWISRGIASKSESQPESIDQLLAHANSLPLPLQKSVLNGMAEAYEGWLKAPLPKSWAAFATGLAGRQDEEKVRELNLLFGDGRAMDELREIVQSKKLRIKTRQAALETLIRARPDDLRQICESVLDQRELNATAAKGLALFDDVQVATRIAEMYRRFHVNDRPAVIEILVSRPGFAKALLDQLEATKNPIPASDVSAFHARQIVSMGDHGLTEQLAKSWGTLRDSPSDRREKIDQWKSELTADRLSEADLSAGRALFQKSCSQCHMLYGDGEKIGPDLTGAQRSSLEYLLGNILDPSAVVGKEYQMSVVLTEDGRVLNGLVVSENDKTLVIQTQNSKETLAVETIEQVKQTSLSPMPDGLLTTLEPDQVRDLIGYLMHPTQVELPKP